MAGSAGPSSMVVFDSIRQSNIPREQKSQIAEWVDRLTGGLGSSVIMGDEGGVSPYIEASMAAVRGSGEALVTGGILGALNSENMLDVKKVPVDFAGGAFLGILSILRARSPSSADLRNAMTSCFSVYAFRKTDALLALRKELRAAPSATPSVSGEKYNGLDDDTAGVDPIVRLAREL